MLLTLGIRNALTPPRQQRYALMHVGTIGFHDSPGCSCRSSMFFRSRFYSDSSSSPPCATLACAFSAPTASFLEFGVCTQLNHRSLCLTSSKNSLLIFSHLFTSLDSCAIFRFGFAYFRIILSDFAVQSVHFSITSFPSCH